MGYLIMSPMFILLLVIPLTVTSFPVSLVSQAESLKSMLRFVDRNPTYAEVLRRAGARAHKCIDDIDDAIDDAIDDDIDDVKDAVILSKVATFLTRYRTPIINYNSKARFSRLSNFQISSMVSPIMISDLAQLCTDIGGGVLRTEKTFRTRILGHTNASPKFLFPLLERKRFRAGNTRFITLDDTDDSDIDHSDVEDSD